MPIKSSFFSHLFHSLIASALPRMHLSDVSSQIPEICICFLANSTLVFLWELIIQAIMNWWENSLLIHIYVFYIIMKWRLEPQRCLVLSIKIPFSRKNIIFSFIGVFMRRSCKRINSLRGKIISYNWKILLLHLFTNEVSCLLFELLTH